MGIVSVIERSRDEASVSGDEITASSIWQVEVSNVLDGGIVAVRAAGLPRIGQRHPTEQDLNAKNKTPSKTEHRRIFNVKVDYSNKGDTEEDKLNPLDEIPSINWDHVEEARIITRDRNGDPVENSSEEPFEDALQGKKGNLALSITRNRDDYNPIVARDFLFSVNSKPITIAGLRVRRPAEVMLIRFSASSNVRNEVRFDTVTTRLIFANPKDKDNPNFNRFVLDIGLNELDLGAIAALKHKRIVDSSLQPVDKPVKLNGAGKVLAKGAAPIYLEFETSVRNDFSKLDLPTERFIAPKKPKRFLEFFGF